jgi:uncharacterized membrane protein
LGSDKASSRTKELVLTSIIAATYGAGTIAISPISYGPIQARLTDALIPTSYNKKIGRAAIMGTTLGCIIANIISPYGLPDIVIGTLANLLASISSYACRNVSGMKGKLLATLAPSITIGLIIGGVLLSYIYGAPLVFTIVTLIAGELVSCVGIGAPLLEALERILS